MIFPPLLHNRDLPHKNIKLKVGIWNGRKTFLDTCGTTQQFEYNTLALLQYIRYLALVNLHISTISNLTRWIYLHFVILTEHKQAKRTHIHINGLPVGLIQWSVWWIPKSTSKLWIAIPLKSISLGIYINYEVSTDTKSVGVK